MKLFRTYNDFLALILILAIIALWVLEGRGVINAQPEISGATIATFTLVVQYYFRRAPPAGDVPPAPPGGAAGGSSPPTKDPPNG